MTKEPERNPPDVEYTVLHRKGFPEPKPPTVRYTIKGTVGLSKRISPRGKTGTR